MKFYKLDQRQQLADLISRANEINSVLALDIETTGLNRFEDKILDVVMSLPSGYGAVMFSPEWVDELRRLKTGLVFHNFMFDCAFLYEQGFDVRDLDIPVRDTMILYHLHNEEGPFGLDSIIQSLYNDDYKKRFWDANENYDDAPDSDKLEYACKDAYYTAKLYNDLLHKLRDSDIPDTLIHHSHRLAMALYDTVLYGIRVDLDYISALGTDLKRESIELHKEMRDLVKDEIDRIELDMWLAEMDKRKTDKGKANVKRPEFNFSSTKQLGWLLFSELGLPGKQTKKGNPKVDDEALKGLKGKHPVIDCIESYRKKQKVYTAYIEGTLERQHKGRIYPGFKIHGTRTGRISSNNPNLQQLPREGNVRGIYTCDSPHNRIISTDYSSLEVVIAAHFSHDEALLRIIRDGESKHDITNESLGLGDRNKAKTLNFAAQYLCGARKMAQILDAPLSEAESIYKRYWETYAGERRVIDKCIEKINKGLPIVNPYGRKRRLKVEPYMAEYEKERLYRQGYNALIQGTGADITHQATYEVYEWLKETGYGRLWFEVHDEIVVEVEEKYCEEVTNKVTSIMVGVGESIGLTVPLSVESSKPLERWAK